MLLDRLARFATGGGHARYEASAAEDIDALVESVRRQLQRLLNAREGMCEVAPDYGLPALSDMVVGAGDHVGRVQDAIRTVVEKFEPRLRRVRVSPQTEDEGRPSHVLRFRIDGVLVTRSGEQRVWYETAMTPTGALNVAG